MSNSIYDLRNYFWDSIIAFTDYPLTNFNMILRAIIFSLIYFFSLPSYAQKTVNLPLDKGEELLDFVDLQEEGFILKTGKVKNYSKDLGWNLSYYSPELDLVWKVPVETSQMDKGLGQDIIASPSGSYVYHLENKGYNVFTGTSEMHVTQINKSGQAKVKEVDKETYEKIEGVKEVKLCDEEYLYIIGLENEDRDEPTTLFLNRFSHKDFAFSKSEAVLPILADDKSISDWEYAGHNSEHIWLVSKTLSEETVTYQFQLVGVNWNGQIAKKLTLNTQIDDLYLRPSQNYKYCPGTEIIGNGFLKTISNPIPSSSGQSSMRYVLETKDWANLLVDEDNGIIYTYGLYGKKQIGKMGVGFTDGFYIKAHNMEGKEVWHQVSTETDPLLEDKYFQKRLLDYQRTTLASLTKNNTIKLQIGSAKNIYTYEFSKEGKKLDSFSNAFDEAVNYDSFFLCFSPKVPAHQYYYTNVSKKNSFYASNSSQRKVLVRYDEKSDISFLSW